MARVNFALGAMKFGNEVAEATASAILDRFVAAGGSMIDTADCYEFWAHSSGHGGQSENLLGRWLAGNPGVRDSVFLSTKVGAEPVGTGDWPANRQGLSAAVIESALRGSLERLGTDRIDLYWAHMEDRATDLAETVTAFGKLVADGAVGRLGVSNHPTWRVERARALASGSGLAGYSALQLRYTYLRPRPGAPIPGDAHPFGAATDETLDYVRVNPDVELWAYTPLLAGGYTRSDRMPEVYGHPGNERRLAALDAVAGELGATRNQVVLAWLAGGDPRITPIVGVSSVAQLDEALAASALTLSAAQRDRLDSADAS
ncbi:MAG: aldo/keto reductase [Actinocatenispora sp.]